MIYNYNYGGWANVHNRSIIMKLIGLKDMDVPAFDIKLKHILI